MGVCRDVGLGCCLWHCEGMISMVFTLIGSCKDTGCAVVALEVGTFEVSKPRSSNGRQCLI